MHLWALVLFCSLAQGCALSSAGRQALYEALCIAANRHAGKQSQP